MEPAGLIVLLVTLLAFIMFPAYLAIGYKLQFPYHFKVKGMKVHCDPEHLEDIISKEHIAKSITTYAKGMQEVFGVSEEEILNRISKVRCVFKKGFLDNFLRKMHGQADSNEDGKVDKILGLTTSPYQIIVGIVTNHAKPDGKIFTMTSDTGGLILHKTAFLYELHNAVIQQLKGYPVSVAESFVKPTNVALQNLLRTDEEGLRALLAERKIYDTALNKVKASLKF